jgi:RHS repeat-associated protein
MTDIPAITTQPPANPYKFTGKERDTESGLDFFQARYYFSPYGRFFSADPENAGAKPDDPQSWNAYAYARNNPLVYTDPDGLAYVGMIRGMKFEVGTWDQLVAIAESHNATIRGNVDKGDFMGWDGPDYGKVGEYRWVITENDNLAALKKAGFIAEPGVDLAAGGVAAVSLVMGAGALAVGGGGAITLGLSPSVVYSMGTLVYATAQLSKPEALQVARSLATTPAQFQRMRSFIQGATTAIRVVIEKFSDGVVRITMSRPGVDGSQSIVRVVDKAGNVNNYQRAVDAAGRLVHLDSKNP